MSETTEYDAAPTDPDVGADETQDPGSIIDTILELDQLLSADVRRAEQTFRLFRRGDLLAVITDLEDQLAAITDELGRPTGGDDSLADAGQARSLALQIQDARTAYYKESGNIRLYQLDPDEWEAFRTKWKKELDKPDGPGTIFWNALIAETVSQPKLTQTQVIKMRQLYGGPQLDKLGSACWQLNTQAGASIPKSPRSSAVLKRLELETN